MGPYMTLALQALKPGFAVEVTGIDLREALEDDALAALKSTLDKYPIVVLPGQDITDAQQIAFSRRFGALDVRCRPINLAL